MTLTRGLTKEVHSRIMTRSLASSRSPIPPSKHPRDRSGSGLKAGFWRFDVDGRERGVTRRGPRRDPGWGLPHWPQPARPHRPAAPSSCRAAADRGLRPAAGWRAAAYGAPRRASTARPGVCACAWNRSTSGSASTTWRTGARGARPVACVTQRPAPETRKRSSFATRRRFPRWMSRRYSRRTAKQARPSPSSSAPTRPVGCARPVSTCSSDARVASSPRKGSSISRRDSSHASTLPARSCGRTWRRPSRRAS